MFELIFLVLMVVVFAKLFKYGLKATWGIAKIVVNLILLPLFLLGLLFKGLLIIAFPILLIVGLVSLFCKN